MATSQQHTLRATMTRRLETRTHQDFDVIAVGQQALFVPPSLYAALDELTCGDLVEAIYSNDYVVVSLKFADEQS
jgi:hypothetical protein